MATNMAFVKTFLCVEKMISLAAIGVLIFAGWGLIPMLFGNAFLDYSAWFQTYYHLQVRKWQGLIVCLLLKLVLQ